MLPPKDYEKPKIKKLEDGVWEDEQGIIYKYSDISNEISPITHYVPDYTMEDFDTKADPQKPDISVFESYNHFVDAMCQISICNIILFVSRSDVMKIQDQSGKLLSIDNE